MAGSFDPGRAVRGWIVVPAKKGIYRPEGSLVMSDLIGHPGVHGGVMEWHREEMGRVDPRLRGGDGWRVRGDGRRVRGDGRRVRGDGDRRRG